MKVRNRGVTDISVGEGFVTENVTLPVGCDVRATVKVVEVPASVTLKVVFDRVTPGSAANAGKDNTASNNVMTAKTPAKIDEFLFIGTFETLVKGFTPDHLLIWFFYLFYKAFEG